MLEDGYYYIKTWNRLVSECKASDIGPTIWINKEIEESLPPTRCIKVEGGYWESERDVFHVIEKWMVESKAYKIGSQVMMRDSVSEEWEGPHTYCGHRYSSLFPHTVKDDQGHFVVTAHVKEYRKDAYEITAKVNGQEIKLSDIPKETLLKIRSNN